MRLWLMFCGAGRKESCVTHARNDDQANRNLRISGLINNGRDDRSCRVCHRQWSEWRQQLNPRLSFLITEKYCNEYWSKFVNLA